jgi:hypothetical protein
VRLGAPVSYGSHERVLDLIFTLRFAFWFRPNVTQILGSATEFADTRVQCGRRTVVIGVAFASASFARTVSRTSKWPPGVVDAFGIVQARFRQINDNLVEAFIHLPSARPIRKAKFSAEAARGRAVARSGHFLTGHGWHNKDAVRPENGAPLLLAPIEETLEVWPRPPPLPANRKRPRRCVPAKSPSTGRGGAGRHDLRRRPIRERRPGVRASGRAAIARQARRRWCRAGSGSARSPRHGSAQHVWMPRQLSLSGADGRLDDELVYGDGKRRSTAT